MIKVKTKFITNMTLADKKIVYIPVWKKTKEMLKEISKMNEDTMTKTLHIATEVLYYEGEDTNKDPAI